MFESKERATVYFDRMVAEIKNKDGSVKEIPIRRTEKNERNRPNAISRYGNDDYDN